MKIKVILSLILVGILAFAAGLGTVAYFTSQATSDDNVFATGTLIIGAPNNGSNTGVFSFRNWYPGYSETKTIDVKNLGTLPFKYRIKADITDDSGANLGNVLNVTITAGTKQIYSGTLAQLASAGFIFDDVLTLGEGESQNLSISVKMQETAGNPYQAASATVKFTFDATQTNNPGWGQ